MDPSVDEIRVILRFVTRQRVVALGRIERRWTVAGGRKQRHKKENNLRKKSIAKSKAQVKKALKDTIASMLKLQPPTTQPSRKAEELPGVVGVPGATILVDDITSEMEQKFGRCGQVPRDTYPPPPPG